MNPMAAIAMIGAGAAASAVAGAAALAHRQHAAACRQRGWCAPSELLPHDEPRGLQTWPRFGAAANLHRVQRAKQLGAKS